MNHTTNYNLSQWDAEDKVLRTDFNADNAKIDAALKKVDDRGLQLIREYRTEETSHLVNIDLSGIDWAEWKIIIIEVYPATGSSMNMHFNHYGYEADAKPISYVRNIMVLFPLGSAQTPLFGITCTTGVSLFYTHYLPINSHAISFEGPTSADRLLAGSRVVIRGERM